MKKCPYCDFILPEEDLIYCPDCELNLTKDIYARSTSMGSIWKSVGVFALIVLLIFGFTKYRATFYDQGYADGSEEVKNEVLFFMSEKYREGYADGEKIAWYFEQGCNDKVNGAWPKYPAEEKYMEGYHFC